jgi:hypothetical protein
MYDNYIILQTTVHTTTMSFTDYAVQYTWGIDVHVMLPLSTIFLLDFGDVPTVWYF